MSKVRTFFSHAAVGIVGSIASVVGLGLAIYFYSAGRGERDLVYTVHPVRTVIAEASESGSLSLLFDGEELVGLDIVAARVAFWNAGELSVRPEHVLEPVILRLAGSARVLRVRITSSSRPVTRIEAEIDSMRGESASVSLDWRILERGDGAVVELLFAGPRDATLELVGTIEGQGSPRLLQPRTQVRAPSEQYQFAISESRQLLVVATIMLVMVLLLGGGTFRIFVQRGELYSRLKEGVGPFPLLLRWFPAVLVVYVLLALGFFAVAFWNWRTSHVEPPFGF